MAGVSPFVGHAQAPARDSHEAPPSLWLGPLVLGGVGLRRRTRAGARRRAARARAAASSRGSAVPVSLALWHGFSRHSVAERPDADRDLSASSSPAARSGAMHGPRARTERLYTLRAVEPRRDQPTRCARSAERLAPLVRADIVVTLASRSSDRRSSSGRVLPDAEPLDADPASTKPWLRRSSSPRRSRRRCARSNMAAVLSLGTVGYGIALIYVLFGAPDLAMTQFAVETLTVVIFVLVFYQLRGFGDLVVPAGEGCATHSSRSPRERSSPCWCSSSARPARRHGCPSYFADAAPTLAHGRNVVNVILVDFRGFDTLGEITVLVTVAIGVRALLRIGRERQP